MDDYTKANTFTCSDCGQTKPIHTTGGTGFGQDDEGNIFCYSCCARRECASMKETGRATLYLSYQDVDNSRFRRYRVGNWTGDLEFNASVRTGRHNIAGVRYDAWFKGPDGYEWHGVTYGDNTQLCHCKRTKRKAS